MLAKQEVPGRFLQCGMQVPWECCFVNDLLDILSTAWETAFRSILRPTEPRLGSKAVPGTEEGEEGGSVTLGHVHMTTQRPLRSEKQTTIRQSVSY